MKTYTPRPVETQAVQWTGTNIDEIRELCGDGIKVDLAPSLNAVTIRTADYHVGASVLDFVIRNPDGTIDTMRADDFRERYQEPSADTYEDGFSDGYAAAMLEQIENGCGRHACESAEGQPELVNHPSHYRSANGKECIDGMVHTYGADDVLAWLRCSAYKYLWRMGMKGPADTDIRKARWCLDRHNSMSGSSLAIDTVMRAIQHFINN